LGMTWEFEVQAVRRGPGPGCFLVVVGYASISVHVSCSREDVN
jgi:hypothetical protein